jgi:hypothetical protein
MHRGLPWSNTTLVFSPLDACGPPSLHWTCNAWGAKSDMLHAHAQLNHINSLQAIYKYAHSIFSILVN